MHGRTDGRKTDDFGTKLIPFFSIEKSGYNNSRVMKLASIAHCHIFSYSLCHSAAFQGEMIKFLLFPFIDTIIRDCNPPSFFEIDSTCSYRLLV